MSGASVAEALIGDLRQCGVDTIYGVTGDASGPGATNLVNGLADAYF